MKKEQKCKKHRKHTVLHMLNQETHSIPTPFFIADKLLRDLTRTQKSNMMLTLEKNFKDKLKPQRWEFQGNQSESDYFFPEPS